MTEQPIVAEADDRKNMVKIPDLLGARNDQEGEDVVHVSQMFAQTSDKSIENFYRATTSHVKGLYLNRVKSRENPLSQHDPSKLTSLDNPDL